MDYRTNDLLCTGYSVFVDVGELIRLNVDFVIPVPTKANSDAVSEAMRNIVVFLHSGKINLVKSTGKRRCFHCAVIANDEDRVCTQCGAPL